MVCHGHISPPQNHPNKYMATVSLSGCATCNPWIEKCQQILFLKKPLKINMESNKNHPIEKKKHHLPNRHVWVLIFWGVNGHVTARHPFFLGGKTLAVFWQVRSTLALVEATLGLNSTGNVVTPLVQRLVFQAGSPRGPNDGNIRMVDGANKNNHRQRFAMKTSENENEDDRRHQIHVYIFIYIYT